MTKYIEPPSNLSDIIELYSKFGSTLSSVERETGYTRNSLRKWFKSAGIKLKDHKQSSTEANRRDTTTLPDKDIFVYDFNNLNIKELQEKYRVGQETLYKWMNIYGLRKNISESISAGKSKSFLAALPHITNLKDEYKKLGFNRSALMSKYDLTRHQIDALFKIHDIETVIPWRSTGEIDLLNTVNSLDPNGNWVASDKKTIAPYELDIYSEKHRLALEYCGLYWHSQISGKKDSNYHLNKWKKCSDKDIRLITIFESDPIDRVQSLVQMLLGKATRFYGRDCSVEQISRTDANAHENENHISGSTGARVYYALKHNKTKNILATMSFGVPRFSKSYQWEIVRYTVKSGCTIVGGAQKLFSRFIADNKPNNVMTYADLRFGSGDIYKRLGFELSHFSGANYWYFQKNSMKLMHRAGFQKHKLRDRLNFFDPLLTEFENMAANGYDRIWDCGNAIYVWKS
jgi:transposase